MGYDCMLVILSNDTNNNIDSQTMSGYHSTLKHKYWEKYDKLTGPGKSHQELIEFIQNDGWEPFCVTKEESENPFRECLIFQTNIYFKKLI